MGVGRLGGGLESLSEIRINWELGLWLHLRDAK